LGGIFGSFPPPNKTIYNSIHSPGGRTRRGTSTVPGLLGAGGNRQVSRAARPPAPELPPSGAGDGASTRLPLSLIRPPLPPPPPPFAPVWSGEGLPAEMLAAVGRITPRIGRSCPSISRPCPLPGDRFDPAAGGRGMAVTHLPDPWWVSVVSEPFIKKQPRHGGCEQWGFLQKKMRKKL